MALLGLSPVSVSAHESLPQQLQRIDARLHAHKQSIALLLERADLLRRLGKLDDALAALLQATALSPHSPEVALARAKVSVERGDLDDAGAALTLVPDHLAQGWALRSRVADARGDRPGAVSAATRALALSPADIEMALYLGRLLEAQGQRDAAAQVYARAFVATGAFVLRAAQLRLAAHDEDFATVLSLTDELPSGDGVLRSDWLLTRATALAATGRPLEAFEARLHAFTLADDLVRKRGAAGVYAVRASALSALEGDEE